MKKNFFKSLNNNIISFIFMLFVFCFAFGLTACGKNDTSKKGNPVVPTYQGMTISKKSSTINTKTSLKLTSYSSIKFLNSTKNNEEGTTDEHEDHDDTLENDIEDIVTIDVKTDDEVKYYVQPNETFIIQVHISNPYDYEIQSFTLNGKKYANYMFKEGSTMELLLLETTAPSSSGYIEYSIDAIKYIDGTEIKDVDMSNGNKSIKAGVAFTKTPKAQIISQNITATSISIDLNIIDDNSLIGSNELSVYLSDGQQVLSKKELKIGDNTITFDNLVMSTTYEYGVITAYDLIDGRDVHSEWLLTNKFTTLGAFNFSNVKTDKTSLIFEINRIGEVGVINSISLYDANTNELVKAGDASTRLFENLLSNHTYNLYADFTYTINGNEISDYVCVKSIKTEAKVKPTLTFDSVTSDKTSVGYTVSTTDTDGILNVTKVELLKNSDSVKDNGTTLSGTFNELLSNNEYTVRVSYTYDLNDGQGAIADSVSKSIKTEAKVKPTLTFDSVTVTDISISESYDVNDPDNLGNIDLVKLLKNDIVLETNISNLINFTNLDYYTEYKVIIEYSYNLNDGKGIINDSCERSYKTSPHLVFNSCKIINTSAVSDGETIYMQISLDNPSGALPSSVVVNGQSYNCTGSTTVSKLYVEIVNNGQFEGGNTTLTIEKVLMKLDGTTYTVEPNSNNSGNIFINGALSVKSLELVNSSNEVVDYCMPDDSMKLLLTLNNKTGYSIDDTSLGTCTKIDDEHYYINVSLKSGWNEYSITSISYHNDSLSKTLGTGGITSNRVYKVNNSTEIEINSVNDLMNTNYNGGYYKLMSNLDLSGIEWACMNEFEGVFDGNGYKIKNMSNVSTIQDKDVTLGLFYSASGILTNVELLDITFMITLNSSTENSYYAYIGGFVSTVSENNITNSLAPYIMCTKFINCKVSGDVSINNTTKGDTIVGGMIGYAHTNPGSWIYIDNCYVDMNISVKEGNKLTGVAAGIVGRYWYTACQFYVYNSYIGGSIFASYSSLITDRYYNFHFYECTIEYKNNSCDIYLNGERETVAYDFFVNNM